MAADLTVGRCLMGGIYMYIPPNTIIKILKDVPLDETYDHTIYFVTPMEQLNYFNTKVKYTLNNNTYQRLNREYMRVGIKAEDLYDCNYIMYQNTSFGNKWFYAFISKIEYINNEVSEIQFQLDVMQTWRFEFYIRESFVERMTPVDDFIGDNIIPETLELGELVYNRNNPDTDLDYGVQIETPTSGVYTIVSIVDTEGSAVEGNMYDGVYGGAGLYCYDTTTQAGVNQLNAKIASYIQKPESIINIYTVPQSIIPNIPVGNKLEYQSTGMTTDKLYPNMNENYTLDGYQPHNCKLYTYPYNFLNFVNGSGGSLALRFEFFKDQVPRMRMSGNITPPVTLKLSPMNYKFIPFHTDLGGAEILDSETLSLTSYPMCSWNSDAYKAWVAQNTIPLLTTAITSLTGIAMGAEFSGVNLLNKVAGAITTGYKASIAADIAKGDFTNGNILVSTNRQHFHGGRMSISYQYARMIDEFFDRFGYAQNRVMTPTEHNRRYWTYIKTIGCRLEGSIPKDDAVKVCNIYDNGCLFFTKESNFTLNQDNKAQRRGYNPAAVHNGYWNPPPLGATTVQPETGQPETGQPESENQE